MTGARSELRDVRGEYGIDGGSASNCLSPDWGGRWTCSYRFRTDPSSIRLPRVEVFRTLRRIGADPERRQLSVLHTHWKVRSLGRIAGQSHIRGRRKSSRYGLWPRAVLGMVAKLLPVGGPWDGPMEISRPVWQQPGGGMAKPGQGRRANRCDLQTGI